MPAFLYSVLRFACVKASTRWTWETKRRGLALVATEAKADLRYHQLVARVLAVDYILGLVICPHSPHPNKP